MGVFSRNKTVNKVILLPADTVQPNPAQPRVHFDPEELQGLAESIRANGILQPLTVRQNLKGEYELISGERRLRAARLIGLEYVPCILVETTAQQSAVFALLENLQRRDLNFFEEARALSKLMIEWNITQEEIAARLGKAQSTIANKMRLLKLTDTQQKKILDGGLTERHARALLKIEDEQMRDKAVYYIIAKHMNVTQAEQYIEGLLKETEEKKSVRKTIPVIKDVRLFINTINKAIDTMKKAGVDAQAEKIEEGSY